MALSRQVLRAEARAFAKAEAHQVYRAGRAGAKLELKSRRRAKDKPEVKHFPSDPVSWPKRKFVHGKYARPKFLRTRTEAHFRP